MCLILRPYICVKIIKSATKTSAFLYCSIYLLKYLSASQVHTEVEKIIAHLLKLKAKYFDLNVFLLNRVNMLQLLRFSFRMSKNL